MREIDEKPVLQSRKSKINVLFSKIQNIIRQCQRKQGLHVHRLRMRYGLFWRGEEGLAESSWTRLWWATKDSEMFDLSDSAQLLVGTSNYSKLTRPSFLCDDIMLHKTRDESRDPSHCSTGIMMRVQCSKDSDAWLARVHDEQHYVIQNLTWCTRQANSSNTAHTCPLSWPLPHYKPISPYTDRDCYSMSTNCKPTFIYDRL